GARRGVGGPPPPGAGAPRVPAITLTPWAEWRGPPRVRRDDGVPITRSKAPEDHGRAAPSRPAAPSPSLHDVALAEVERHGGAEASWQWTPPKPPPMPIAADEPAPVPDESAGPVDP